MNSWKLEGNWKGTGAYAKKESAKETVKEPEQAQKKELSKDALTWSDDTSSRVKEISFDNGMLYVTFRDGTTVEYDNIELSLAKAFIESDSKGRFVNAHLKGISYKVV